MNALKMVELACRRAINNSGEDDDASVFMAQLAQEIQNLQDHPPSNIDAELAAIRND